MPVSCSLYLLPCFCLKTKIHLDVVHPLTFQGNIPFFRFSSIRALAGYYIFVFNVNVFGKTKSFIFLLIGGMWGGLGLYKAAPRRGGASCFLPCISHASTNKLRIVTSCANIYDHENTRFIFLVNSLNDRIQNATDHLFVSVSLLPSGSFVLKSEGYIWPWAYLLECLSAVPGRVWFCGSTIFLDCSIFLRLCQSSWDRRGHEAVIRRISDARQTMVGFENVVFGTANVIFRSCHSGAPAPRSGRNFRQISAAPSDVDPQGDLIKAMPSATGVWLEADGFSSPNMALTAVCALVCDFEAFLWIMPSILNHNEWND